MTRFTLHVPRQYNDGSPVPRSELELVEQSLLDIAGGYTAVDANGAWRGPGGRVYRDPVTLYHVDVDDDVELVSEQVRATADFVAARLEQEAVYVTAANVSADLVTAEVAA